MWHRLHRMIGSRPTLTLAILLLLVLLVRLVVAGLILYPDRPDRALNTDQWGGIAKNLVDGYGYVGGHGNQDPETAGPNSERGPVPVLFYAAWFWLFGYELWVVMAANWLCDVGTAYVLYRIAREIFTDHLFVAYASILLWALYIPEVTITNRTFSEPLFTLLLAGHVWTILKLQQRLSWQVAILSGALLGAASLARGHMVLFFPVVWLLLLSSKGLNRQMFDAQWLKKVVPICVVVFVAFGMTFLPWVIRNYLVLDAFTPTGTTLGGYCLLMNNIELNTEDYRFLPDRLEGLTTRQIVRAKAEDELQTQGETLVGKSKVEVDRIYTELALERIRAYPGRYLIASGYRFLRLWFNVGYGARPSTASYMVMVANAILLGVSVTALILPKEAVCQKGMPAVGIVVYNTAIYTLFHGQVRYIFPVMPYAIMFASFTLVWLTERVSH